MTSSFSLRYSIMTLHSDPVDPLSHAVRFILAEKAVNVEVIYANDDQTMENLHHINPYGQILTLVDRDLVLYDAQIIMEYVDERFPHPPLMPVDPVSRAQNRIYRYRIQRDLYEVMSRIDDSHGEERAEAEKQLHDGLTSIAPIFGQMKYFMSEDFSLVDCFLAPILWRLPYYGVNLPLTSRPLLKFADRIFQRKAFQSSLSEPERDMRQR